MRLLFLLSSKPEYKYRTLLFFCFAMLLLFSIPDALYWVGALGYTVLAFLIMQVTISSGSIDQHDMNYRNIGLFAIASIWFWSLTPIEIAYSGIPVVFVWSVFVCWGVIRLVKLLAASEKINANSLFAAAAGYMLLGIVSGLIFSAIETIAPSSFEPLLRTSLDASNMDSLAYSRMFSALNYYAFVCLTTLGFGDIVPVSSMARIASVVTGLFGTFYLAAIIGLLIGRYSSSVSD